jgi:hypothetical protein
MDVVLTNWCSIAEKKERKTDLVTGCILLNFVFDCIALHCIALHCIALPCIRLCLVVLCSFLCFILLWYVVLCLGGEGSEA